MLFVKIGSGKLLRKIDSVEVLHKSDYDKRGEYWPFLHDKEAYYYDGSGYNVTDVDSIVEANENEVVKMFPLADNSVWYKWEE